MNQIEEGINRRKNYLRIIRGGCRISAVRQREREGSVSGGAALSAGPESRGAVLSVSQRNREMPSIVTSSGRPSALERSAERRRWEIATADRER
jgi:hypothetical protein